MTSVHVAVFGVGAFGRHHVRHLAGHPAVHRVSVVDLCADRAERVARAHGAVAAGPDIECDAAVVAVPTEHHFAVASALLARGVPVLVEKPLAANDREAAALVALAARAGVTLQVGHIERFAPAIETLAKRADGVRHIAVRRHNPPRETPPAADVVLDLMIHDIDLAMALAGETPSAVAAVPMDGTGQEAATARLVFPGGVVADVSASRLSAATERQVTVHAANGVWRADLVDGRLDHRTEGGLVPVPLLTGSDKLAAEIDEFVAAVRGEAVPRVDGRSGAAALAVANRVRAALLAPAYRLSA